jgi:MFS family permease
VGDRFDKLLVGIGALVLAGVGLGSLLAVESLALVAGSIAVMAVGFRSFSPVALAYLMDAFPDDSMGGDLGAARTVWGFIASFGTTYVGLVAGRSSYTVAYLGLIGCLALSLGLLAIVRLGDR